MNIWAFPSFYPFDYPGKRWNGIFAHRQYKGLIEIGAKLKVVQPVKWFPPAPFSSLPKWRKGPHIKYPDHRVYDGIKVFHPKIVEVLPYALDKRSYVDKYTDALDKMFKNMGVKLQPGKDIFYSQWLPESYIVQKAAHRLGIKSAILSIGDDVVVWPNNNSRDLQQFKELIAGADLRFTCADYLGRETDKIMGSKYPYDVVRWGVDYDFFAPATPENKVAFREKYQLPSNKLLILNVGSAIVRKGWLDLFDAMKMARKNVDNFAIVGVHAGFNDINLYEEAEKRGLKDVFYNLGEVPPSQLNEVFKAVDIFCLPSHWEGLANANIEAMSSGLPVVTTDVSGHPELITDGHNGILIKPKNPEMLAGKLQLLLTDDDLRTRLAQTGREFIVKDWGNFADNARLLLRKLADAYK